MCVNIKSSKKNETLRNVWKEKKMQTGDEDKYLVCSSLFNLIFEKTYKRIVASYIVTTEGQLRIIIIWD